MILKYTTGSVCTGVKLYRDATKQFAGSAFKRKGKLKCTGTSLLVCITTIQNFLHVVSQRPY